VSGRALVAAATTLGWLALLASCARPAVVGCRETSCGGAMACVAGRCEPRRPGTRPAIDDPSVVRLVLPATAMGYVHEGSDGSDVPPVYDLGRSGHDAELLLRFERPTSFYRSLGRIVEAYLVLPRADEPGLASPAPTSLAVARVAATWSPATASWSHRPTLASKARSTTMVLNVGAPISPRLVRFDVKALVESWRLPDAKEQGLAVTGDKDSASGLSFATPAAADAVTLPGGGLPFLELYLAP
jgi:hypothetical protein